MQYKLFLGNMEANQPSECPDGMVRLPNLQDSITHRVDNNVLQGHIVKQHFFLWKWRVN